MASDQQPSVLIVLTDLQRLENDHPMLRQVRPGEKMAISDNAVHWDSFVLGAVSVSSAQMKSERAVRATLGAIALASLIGAAASLFVQLIAATSMPMVTLGFLVILWVTLAVARR